MPFVANRYYNSPWIAQAGQNLASALAPEDPEKTLAMQREKWKFEQLQMLAGQEQEDRTRTLEGREALGRLAAGNYETPPDMVPHSPGQAAFLRAGSPTGELPVGNPSMRDADFQKAVAGGNFNEAMTAEGPNSPKYKALLAMQDDKQFARWAELGFKSESDMRRAAFNQGAQTDRAWMTDDRMRDLAGDNEMLRIFLAMLAGRQQKEHDDRVSARPGGGGPPMDVSPMDSMYLSAMIDQQAKDWNVQLTPEQKKAVANDTNAFYQTSRNAKPSLDKAFEKHFGPNPKITAGEDPWFSAPKPGTVESLPGVGLGDIVVPGTAPPAAAGVPSGVPFATSPLIPAQVAPATAPGLPSATSGPAIPSKDTPPPKEKLVEGKTRWFPNGTAWTLVNDTPRRVK